jgi:hypothetical protein
MEKREARMMNNLEVRVSEKLTWTYGEVGFRANSYGTTQHEVVTLSEAKGLEPV